MIHVATFPVLIWVYTFMLIYTTVCAYIYIYVQTYITYVYVWQFGRRFMVLFLQSPLSSSSVVSELEHELELELELEHTSLHNTHSHVWHSFVAQVCIGGMWSRIVQRMQHSGPAQSVSGPHLK